MQDTQELEKALRQRLSVLRNRMEEIDDDLGELGDDDFAEAATESADDQVLESVGRMADDETKQILHALDRIKQGEYGKCEKCGTDIAPKRLEAVPHTSLCIECAEA